MTIHLTADDLKALQTLIARERQREYTTWVEERLEAMIAQATISAERLVA